MQRTERKGNTIQIYRNNELVHEITLPEEVEVIEKDGHFIGYKFPDRVSHVNYSLLEVA